ncbi:Crp/Fnr family transcriptional regulator [Sphingomonas sp.]|uniref:Crp/Fnr family transcriptional regulator n=1 Tax=Sphingomonas sp. TaxID=28214 RepID=UPI0025FEE559|nr:Crp/Fnr family transcriptional regulator [Sphingomonas sp.]MBV9527360.1 Crp/Fnr family transcriptional regulator [Sphingomonas sp.]
MITVHLKKLRHRTDISADEERAIRGAVAGSRTIAADEIFVRSGDELNSATILLSGWMSRSKDLPSGERQVTELHVAGDIVDLHGFTLKRLDHDVMTLTECVVATLPHERLLEITSGNPHLARVYWFQTNVDAAIHREWALSLGQRSAISRMASLFCELHMRLSVVGRTNGEGYEFPLTQRELSECLGLTVVHANRTLQELRRRGLVELENRFVRILDRSGLEGLAEFDPSYLYLDRQRI